jgi:glutamate/tyrosine decarboxylase-like PLP-dependent enzyme
MARNEVTRRQFVQVGSVGAAALFLQSHLFPNLSAAEVAAVLPDAEQRTGPAVRAAGDEGLAALLEPPLGSEPVDVKAAFLGPQAENADWVEGLLLEVYRDYVFWRRNFHPEDRAAIQPRDLQRQTHQEFVGRFKRELFTLLGELKSDIPFFSPRYIGHMTADVSLPALIGYIATMLYNPNNVSWEASPITTLIEIELGRELAKMFGFGRTPEELAGTWGHITSGGTLANLESIWVAKAVKFLPVAVRQAAAALGVQGLTAGAAGKPLEAMTAWELVNLLPGEALQLKDALVRTYLEKQSRLPADEALAQVSDQLKRHEILFRGDHAFFTSLTGKDSLLPGILCAPQTMHYSWVKGPGAIGIGAGQVVPIPINAGYRMDLGRLREELEKALRERRPVIAVVGVAGTTEEGAVDPMHELVALRQEFAGRGLGFSLHCDAAYGGYLAACFRSPEGELRSQTEMQGEYGGWPATAVYESYAALKDVESITVDPHKLGFVPYPAGAIVFRDGRVKELVAQEASYALGGRTSQPHEVNIGKYILEGSKPGAAAAATFLSHRVMRLDQHGYGKLLGQTLRVARSFHDRLRWFAQTIRGEFIVQPLFLPDTNILDYTFNVAGNDRLDLMNRFNQRVYQELSIDPMSPVQTRRFIVSHTEFAHEQYNPQVVGAFLETQMGIRAGAFVSAAERIRRERTGTPGSDDAVIVFRSTMMNLFTLEKVRREQDYLDLFLGSLLPLLRKARQGLI